MVGPRKLRRGEDLCLCCLLLMSLFIPLNSREGFGLNGSFTAFFFFWRLLSFPVGILGKHLEHRPLGQVTRGVKTSTARSST